MLKILRFASIYKEATRAETHRWASNIVTQAFQRVMGRMPTAAERQIVMAVADLESNYGRGWKAGKGSGSHNWGAVQTRSKTAPSFSHKDSSAEGSYMTRFKVYPGDVSGAADVVSHLFKNSRKQQLPDPKHSQRTLGGSISGPNRGELIEAAAQQGDTLAFSKAMWYTTYFEGVAPEFTKRIKDHANGIQKRIESIAASLGEPAAWSIKSNNYLPVTNDQSVINKIINMNPKAVGNGSVTFAPQNTQPRNTQQYSPSTKSIQSPLQDFTSIENMLWF